MAMLPDRLDPLAIALLGGWSQGDAVERFPNRIPGSGARTCSVSPRPLCAVPDLDGAYKGPMREPQRTVLNREHHRHALAATFRWSSSSRATSHGWLSRNHAPASRAGRARLPRGFEETLEGLHRDHGADAVVAHRHQRYSSWFCRMTVKAFNSLAWVDLITEARQGRAGPHGAAELRYQPDHP